MQIQLNIPSNCFPVAHFFVIVAMFLGFFYAVYELNLVINFVADAVCMGLRSCPFNETTWQMLHKACMDKPYLCQALHIIVNPITDAPQASRMENIPKYDNDYKKNLSESVFEQSKRFYLLNIVNMWHPVYFLTFMLSISSHSSAFIFFFF